MLRQYAIMRVIRLYGFGKSRSLKWPRRVVQAFARGRMVPLRPNRMPALTGFEKPVPKKGKRIPAAGFGAFGRRKGLLRIRRRFCTGRGHSAGKVCSAEP